MNNSINILVAEDDSDISRLLYSIIKKRLRTTACLLRNGGTALSGATAMEHGTARSDAAGNDGRGAA